MSKHNYLTDSVFVSPLEYDPLTSAVKAIEAEVPAFVVSVSFSEIFTLNDCNTSEIDSGSGVATEIFTSLLPEASSVGISPETFTVAVKLNVSASDEVVGVPVKMN